MNKIKHIFVILLLANFLTSSLTLYAQVNPGLQKNQNEKKEVCNFGKNFWVIYDSVCPYCKQAKKYISELDWEGKFNFISYRDPMTYKMFPILTKEECEKDVHMVTPDGKVLSGYEVFRTIIDNLTATKILNPLLKNDFAEKKLNEIYEKMVKKRTCYYKKGTCGLSQKTNQAQQVTPD